MTDDRFALAPVVIDWCDHDRSWACDVGPLDDSDDRNMDDIDDDKTPVRRA